MAGIRKVSARLRMVITLNPIRFRSTAAAIRPLFAAPCPWFTDSTIAGTKIAKATTPIATV
jgi:hypothetical protein